MTVVPSLWKTLTLAHNCVLTRIREDAIPRTVRNIELTPLPFWGTNQLGAIFTLGDLGPCVDGIHVCQKPADAKLKLKLLA
jgi:hypothetical protein